MHQSQRQSTLFALAAIALWGSLAALGLALAHVPPFLLTGVALLVGSLIALPMVWRDGRLDLRALLVPWPSLAVGVYGLFGFHFLLFVALRLAPPVEANLVNYLWPLLMVVLAPVVLPGMRLSAVHVVAAAMGFGGAALAIAGGGGSLHANHAVGSYTGLQLVGFGAAGCSAFVWASYSLLTQRVPRFPTAAIGGFAAISGVLALLCHLALEPAAVLSGQDWALLALTGAGPLGAAFYLWDAALKRGDARRLGLLSFATPLLSTCVLLLVRAQMPTWHVLLAAVLIVGAAVVGSRNSA